VCVHVTNTIQFSNLIIHTGGLTYVFEDLCICTLTGITQIHIVFCCYKSRPMTTVDGLSSRTVYNVYMLLKYADY